jgi:hypothetical protein
MLITTSTQGFWGNASLLPEHPASPSWQGPAAGRWDTLLKPKMTRTPNRTTNFRTNAKPAVLHRGPCLVLSPGWHTLYLAQLPQEAVRRWSCRHTVHKQHRGPQGHVEWSLHVAPPPCGLEPTGTRVSVIPLSTKMDGNGGLGGQRVHKKAECCPGAPQTHTCHCPLSR